MLEIAAVLALYVIGVTIAYFLGRAAGISKTRRESAAVARCGGCDWQSDPGTLAEAFRAAEGHTAGPEHRGIVVRA